MRRVSRPWPALVNSLYIYIYVYEFTFAKNHCHHGLSLLLQRVFVTFKRRNEAFDGHVLPVIIDVDKT